MADIQNTTGTTENQGATEKQGQTTETQVAQDEKKYSEAEMNGISKKNSEKAVNKLLKELGITDREKAKQILKQAAEQEAGSDAQTSSTGNEDVNAQLQSELAAERAQKETALLEAVFLTEKVNPAKVAKAVKLIDINDCRDDDGKFDLAKASEAVKALLKEWPELAPKDENSNVGFQIGSDGQQATGGSKAAEKKTAPKKSWNRFN